MSLSELPHRHPINLPYRISSHYGPRTYVENGVTKKDWHYGTDYAPRPGNDMLLHAVSTGVCFREGEHWKSGYYAWYNFDFIDGRVWQGLYAHMAHRSPISAGSRVDVGQWVGTVGNTGHSTGLHLHFEVIDDQGIKRDPEMWLENLRLISENRKLLNGK